MEILSSGEENIKHGSFDFPVAIYTSVLEEEAVAWHWHSELELICVLEGAGHFFCNGKEENLMAGQGMFINGGNLHGCYVEDGEHCMFHSIVFNPRFVSGGTSTILWSRYMQPLTENKAFDYGVFDSRVDSEKQALDSIESAWQLATKQEEGFEFFVRNELSSVIYTLYSAMKKMDVEPINGDSRKLTRMKHMIEYICLNYADNIKIKDIAMAAKVSESECQRCFKSTINVTPIKYLMDLRLQRACELLTSTNLSAAKIAEMCGFQDNSYFGKVFKKEKHMTPAAFRSRGGGHVEPKIDLYKI